MKIINTIRLFLARLFAPSSALKRQPNTGKWRGRVRGSHGAVGYKGVAHSRSKRNPYRAQIHRAGKCVHLGNFPTAKDAALAFDAAAVKQWGPATYLNFPHLVEAECFGIDRCGSDPVGDLSLSTLMGNQ